MRATCQTCRTHQVPELQDIAKALYMRGHEKTPRVCEDGEEEGHFVPAEMLGSLKCVPESLNELK